MGAKATAEFDVVAQEGQSSEKEAGGGGNCGSRCHLRSFDHFRQSVRSARSIPWKIRLRQRDFRRLLSLQSSNVHTSSSLIVKDAPGRLLQPGASECHTIKFCADAVDAFSLNPSRKNHAMSLLFFALTNHIVGMSLRASIFYQHGSSGGLITYNSVRRNDSCLLVLRPGRHVVHFLTSTTVISSTNRWRWRSCKITCFCALREAMWPLAKDTYLPYTQKQGHREGRIAASV